ncbi:hypothetical protein ACLB1E_04015 [Escherichia coli]
MEGAGGKSRISGADWLDCAHQNQQEKTFIDLIITKQIDGMLLLGSRLPV